MSRKYGTVGFDRETDRLVVEEIISEVTPLTKRSSSSPDLFSSNKTKLLVTLCILVTEMCERLTYYSIMAGLVLFCQTQLGIKQTDASTINQVFSGFVYIIPILGGFIADSYAGRFKTIFVCCIIYIAGTIMLPAAALDYSSLNLDELTEAGKTGVFMTGLVLVAIGTGGIKANVGPFGAEQVEALGKGAVQSYFNWFYWVINVGALIAYTVVAYVQQEISFAWGFFVPMASMILGLLIFGVVKSKYIRTRPQGSIFSTAFSICKQGRSSKSISSRIPDGKKMKILYKAKKTYGGDFDDNIVDGVVSVIKVIPFCVLVIFYWAIYAQMTNTFFAQSERMDIRLGDGIQIPAAALNAFDTIIIILLIPVVDRVIYPLFERIGKPLTYLKRIGIGLVFSALAVAVAGVVEIYRKEYLFAEGGSHIQVLGGDNFTASSMSVFVQIPQFALIGISEIFASVTSLEFAYNQAPVSMQGLLTGLFLAASGFGNWLSSLILVVVQAATEGDPWWGDEINNLKMENLMFLLAGLAMLNFFIFCIVAHYYTYQDPKAFEKASPTENGADESDFMDQKGITNHSYEEPKLRNEQNVNASVSYNATTGDEISFQ